MALSVPIYWQTRQTMEEELSRSMEKSILLIRDQLNSDMIGFLNRFPESKTIEDSVGKSLNSFLPKVSAEALYILQSGGQILASAGNRESAVKSVMLHSGEISSALDGIVTSSPLFSDESGKYFKSTFCTLNLSDGSAVILAIDANASFLKDTARLRLQIMTVGIIVLIAGIGLSVLASKTLTRPLDQLTHYAALIGKGRNRTNLLKLSNDEIGFLGETMQKMQSEISRREKENKQLLASIAHEIRNPLAGMKINAELLIEESMTNPDLAKYATAISCEVNRLSEIIDAFLTYARPLESNIIECDIPSLLTESITEVCKEFPNHKIILTGTGKANVNPGKMRQAFYNILKNAAEASSEKDAIIVNLQSSGGDLHISFVNRGTPIPTKIQPQLFEAFFSTKSTGVGLGLSIAKSIVEQHGGSIRLARSDGNGTEFVVTLAES